MTVYVSMKRDISIHRHPLNVNIINEWMCQLMTAATCQLVQELWEEPEGLSVCRHTTASWGCEHAASVLLSVIIIKIKILCNNVKIKRRWGPCPRLSPCLKVSDVPWLVSLSCPSWCNMWRTDHLVNVSLAVKLLQEESGVWSSSCGEETNIWELRHWQRPVETTSQGL